MTPEQLISAIRAALDAQVRHVESVRDFIPEAHQGEFIDPAAVLRRVAADRELVNMAATAFLSAGVFRDIDERWGAVEMQYLHVMRTLARGLGINPEEETG